MSVDDELNPEEEQLWQSFHDLPMPQDPPLTFDVTRWTKNTGHLSQRLHLKYMIPLLGALIIGGASFWALRAIPSSPPASSLALTNLSEIHMNTVSTGWAIGNNFKSLYHTTSGGQYWSKVLALASVGQMPYAMGFPTANNAQVIVLNTPGDTVSIEQTRDQGKRWKTTTLPIHPAGLSGGTLMASNGRQYLGIGVLIGHSQTVALFYHINGNASWHQVQYTPDLYNLDALSSGPHGSLWMVAQRSPGHEFAVFQSHDSGKHWLPVHLPPLPVKSTAFMPLEPKFFGNDGILPVMVNVSGTPPAFPNAQVWIYRTQDGGKRWTPWTHYRSMLGNLQAVSLNHMWAVVTMVPLLMGNQQTKAGFSLITLHHNHWVSLPLPSEITDTNQQDQLLQIDFADVNTGWMIVDNGNGNGQLWVTHDGGKRWYQLHPRIDS